MLILEKQQPTTPIDAIKNCFIEFANFSGKASRYECWCFLLFMILVMTIATLLHEKLYQIVTIIFIVPFIAVCSRRLNDIGQSVWWQLFYLVPFGQIIVLYMMAKKSIEISEQQ
ncbi:MAG: DUF805 domain-containing protein [Firmicutes bacterium]|nr:DUF805 domain-containing protein [Bacillota bacterium]